REREEAGEIPFANPRNAAAGAIRQLDPAEVAKRRLSAFTYQLLAADPPSSHADILKALASWRLPVELHWRACAGIDEVCAFCEEWATKRHDLEFETDGVVI